MAGDEIISGEVVELTNFVQHCDFKYIMVRIKNFHPIWHGYKFKRTSQFKHIYVHLNPPIPRKKWKDIKWKPYFGVSVRVLFKRKGLRFEGHHSRMTYMKKPLSKKTLFKNV